MLPFDSWLMTASCAGPAFAQTFREEKALKPELFTGWLWTPLVKEQVLLVPHTKAALWFGASGGIAGKSPGLPGLSGLLGRPQA